MELNCETTTLSFSKGMTNIPSDMISEDGELMESVGFVYRNGEMIPIQKPVCITGDNPVEGKLVYCHKQADYRNLVTYIEDEENGSYTLKLYVGFKSGNVEERLVQTVELGAKLHDIKSNANTLVCATDKGLCYYLFKGKSYKVLGYSLPDLVCNFSFSKPTGNYQLDERTRTLMDISNDYDYRVSDDTYYDIDGKFIKAGGGRPTGDYSQGPYTSYTIKSASDGSHEISFQNTVQGHVAQAISWVKEKNMFAFPFFIRCAFRLFDGSYAKITNPIICYPTINRNCRFSSADYNNKTHTFQDLNQVKGTSSLFCFMEYSELLFRFKPISSDWSDIVKDIVVFASDQVIPFNLNGDWKFVSPNTTYMTPFANFGFKGYSESVFNYDQKGFNGKTINVHDEIQPTYKSDIEIKDELVHKSQFYKLFSVGIGDDEVDGEYHSTVTRRFGESRSLIKDNIVSNLTTQSQLGVDDYYGWARMSADKLFTYNKRLNLVGAKRYPFEGFSYFVGREVDTNKDEAYMIYTHIVTDTCDKWVSCGATMNDSFLRGWIFYPDTNAREVILFKRGKYLRIQLMEHPMLNGSYSFTNLPSKEGDAVFKDISDEEFAKLVESANDYEDLNSQIYTSNVNNPFVFEASGDNTVGTGKIYGIVSNTEAVSTGQFGQYPLLVFTSEGIYGMSVNAEGLYSNSYPISREVCNKNSPFVPTGNMVFFTGLKGLMATSGGSVAFMSNKMSGYQTSELRTLDDGALSRFLRDCMIAYDYNESLLRIFAKGKSYQYIYNTVDQTFAMDNSGIEAQAIVNDYPDNLIQDTEGNVYSLTDKPAAIDDENLYSGYLITRPLKFTGSMILKSLREIHHLKKSADGKLSLEVWASNNAVNWCKLESRGGKPWAYFTFKYNLTDFKASDAFTGSLVRVQNRRALMHNMEF